MCWNPLNNGWCTCVKVFWTFVGGLESADDELSGRGGGGGEGESAEIVYSEDRRLLCQIGRKYD